ncbi:hypothetical protein [Tumebacillus permanentifrigoris]|uniref:Uncharacterized protein n=1 Tax=Tumebacillus permanentifrigoris TaxID=378543 RepID=A0A316DD81_9BACL|nr:hypothetical protein [Tumebacillus permanentifrigoris]PWK13418.1 hypothetical protein C7459_10785 [Tumebacillus permanentifrigoris]
MFDPTIFDNLKVVFEGALYDLDHDRRLLVSGREDLVDLAAMARQFRMQVRKPDSEVYATLILKSGLIDFAGELRSVRTADELPGCELEIHFQLPAEKAARAVENERHLQEVWGEVASSRHELSTVLMADPASAGKNGLHVAEPTIPGHYRISLRFRSKIDEDNITDVEPLLQHLVATMEFLDEAE